MGFQDSAIVTKTVSPWLFWTVYSAVKFAAFERVGAAEYVALRTNRLVQK